MVSERGNGWGRIRCRGNAADTEVVIVGDIEPIGAIEVHAAGGEQRGSRGQNAIAVIFGSPGTRHRGDNPGDRIYSTDALIARIGEIKIVGVIQGQMKGGADLGGCGEAAIATIACRPRANHRGDDPRSRVHFANTRIVRLGNIKVANTVNGHINGTSQLSGCSEAAVTRDAEHPVTRDGGDHPRDRIHLADTLVVAISNIEIIRTVEG